MTEVCVQVNATAQDTVNHLVKLGFRLTTYHTNDDYYFTHFNKTETMDKTYKDLITNSLLIRKRVHPEKAYAEEYLLYKKKATNQNNEVISETFLRSDLETFQSTIKIFKKMNMYNWCHIITRNYRFFKDKLRITIQVVDNLGVFLEIENTELKNENAYNTFNILKHTADSLGLPLMGDYSCKRSYMLYLKQNNLTVPDETKNKYF